MRKATTSSFFDGKFSRLGKVPVRTAKRFFAGALSAALVLSGVNLPGKSASAASAKLNKSGVVLYVGGNATAKIKAKNVKKVTYKSKDTSVAKVNKNTGKITAIGAGKTKVVAKTDAGKLKCAVRVYKAIKTLTPDTDAVTLAPGDTQTVSVGVKPAKANDTMWEVATSDKSVAKKQRENGKKGTFDIIGVAEGTATITVRAADGGSAPDATIKVNVVAAEDENTAKKDTEETETLPAEDENTDGEETEETKETETPSQAEIVIKADSAPTGAEGAKDENAAGEADAALTNAEGTEMYVYYETYNELGNKIDNPTMGWTISNNAGETFDYEDRNDPGILVIKANVEYDATDSTKIVGGTFTKGNILHIYGKSTDSDVTIEKDIVVGEVREITTIEVAGITETVYSGWRSETGEVFRDPNNTLPFGFDEKNYAYSCGDGSGEGTSYYLALNAYDQNGDYMVNWDFVDYDENGAASDKMMVKTMSTDEPASVSVGAASKLVGNGVDSVTRTSTVDGVQYNEIIILGGDEAQIGGTGYFVLSGGTRGGYMEYEYTVGTSTNLESLALAAPTTRVHDGEGATIGVNGVFEDGTVYENISVAKLKEELGSEALNNISVSASEVESSDGLEDEREGDTLEDISISTYADGSSACSLNLDGETAVFEWTDSVTNPYEEKNIFDDAVRTVQLEVGGSPVDFTGLELKVYDPSRPVDVELSSWDSGAIRVEGTDEMVKFIDQYGEMMAEDVDNIDEVENVMSFFSYAMSNGYIIDDETSYFGIALVSGNDTVKIGTFGKVRNIYSDYGITWGLEKEETINNALMEIVECSGGSGDVSTDLKSGGEPAGGSASLGTVENIVCSSTFAASGVTGTLECRSDYNWYFTGSISGTVTEIKKGGFIGDEIDATASLTDEEPNSLEIKDESGNVCGQTDICAAHKGSSTFTATFSVSVTSALDENENMYEVEETKIYLSAIDSSKGSTNTVRSCFRTANNVTSIV